MSAWKKNFHQTCVKEKLLPKNAALSSCQIAHAFASDSERFGKWAADCYVNNRLALKARVHERARANGSALYGVLAVNGLCADVSDVVMQFYIPHDIAVHPHLWLSGVQWTHMLMTQLNTPIAHFPPLGVSTGRTYFSLTKFPGYTKVKAEVQALRKRKRQ